MLEIPEHIMKEIEKISDEEIQICPEINELSPTDKIVGKVPENLKKIFIFLIKNQGTEKFNHKELIILLKIFWDKLDKALKIQEKYDLNLTRSVVTVVKNDWTVVLSES